MGQARGGGARHTAGRNGQDTWTGWRARDAVAEDPRTPQARDLQEEVGGSPPMSWSPGLLEEAGDTEQAEAGPHGCWRTQEAHLSVFPAEDRSLPHRVVLEILLAPCLDLALVP